MAYAKTSAKMSIGSTMPVAWRAGMRLGKIATNKIEDPGIPVFEKPAIIAPAISKTHCHGSKLMRRSPADLLPHAVREKSRPHSSAFLSSGKHVSVLHR